MIIILIIIIIIIIISIIMIIKIIIMIVIYNGSNISLGIEATTTTTTTCDRRIVRNILIMRRMPTQNCKIQAMGVISKLLMCVLFLLFFTI